MAKKYSVSLVIKAITAKAVKSLKNLLKLTKQIEDPSPITITADIESARKSLEQITKKLTDLSGDTASINVRAQTSDALRDIQQIKDALDSMSGESASIDVKAEVSAAKIAVQNLEKVLKEISQQAWKVEVKASTSAARTKLEAIKDLLKEIAGYSSAVSVAANVSNALLEIRKVKNALEDLTGQTWTVRVRANTSGAVRDVQELRDALNDLPNNTNANVNANINGLSAATGIISGWKAAIAGLLGVGGLSVLSKQMGDVTAVTKRWSDYLGESFSEYNKLRNFVLPQFRVQVEDLDDAGAELQRRIRESIQHGTGAGHEAFLELGINVKTFDALDFYDQLDLISKKLFELTQSGKTFNLDELFGGAGEKIYPLLQAINEASGGIRGLTKEAEKFGFGISDADAVAVKENQKAWTNIGLAIKGAMQQTNAQLAPIMKQVADKISGAIAPDDIRPKINSMLATASYRLADFFDDIGGLYEKSGFSGVLDKLLFGDGTGLSKKLSEIFVKISQIMGLVDGTPAEQLAEINKKIKDTQSNFEKAVAVTNFAVGKADDFRAKIQESQSALDSGKLSIAGSVAAAASVKLNTNDLNLASREAEKSALYAESLNVRIEELYERKKGIKALIELQKEEEAARKETVRSINENAQPVGEFLRQAGDQFTDKSENPEKYDVEPPKRQIDNAPPRFGELGQEIARLTIEISELDASSATEVARLQHALNRLESSASLVASETGNNKQLREVNSLQIGLNDKVQTDQEALARANIEAAKAAAEKAKKEEKERTFGQQAKINFDEKWFDIKPPTAEEEKESESEKVRQTIENFRAAVDEKVSQMQEAEWRLEDARQAVDSYNAPAPVVDPVPEVQTQTDEVIQSEPMIFEFGQAQEQVNQFADQVSNAGDSIKAEYEAAQRRVEELTGRGSVDYEREQIHNEIHKNSISLNGKRTAAEEATTNAIGNTGKAAQGAGSMLDFLSNKAKAAGNSVHSGAYGLAQRFMSGGAVWGPGSGDTVPALLRNGEHVLTPENVTTIGAQNLQTLKTQGVDGLRPIVNVTPQQGETNFKAIIYQDKEAAVQDFMSSPGSRLYRADNRGYE